MKRIIAVIGKTRGGKDTVANYITANYGINAVCSYTTRPKRDYETDGVEHYFVSDERMKEILETEHIIAYVKKPNGVQYGASIECLNGDIVIYIIDPDGIKDLEKTTRGMDIDIIKLYIQCPEDLILERALNTGVDLEVTKERLKYERDEFDSYYNADLYDYCIENDDTLELLKENVDIFMNKYFSEVKKLDC